MYKSSELDQNKVVQENCCSDIERNKMTLY